MAIETGSAMGCFPIGDLSGLILGLLLGLTVCGQPSAAADDDATETSPAAQEHESGRGRGPGMGRGMGRGFQGGRGPGAKVGNFQADMRTIHAMFDNRDKIRRSVMLLPDGAESLTESDDEELAAMLKDHVPNMDARVLGNAPLPPMTFHPVFVALIKHADDYTLDYEETDKGVKVTYQSDDPYVVMLVQEHAKLVSRFLQNGHDEIHADYELPEFDEVTAAAKAKALKARGMLFTTLSSRLGEVIKAKGPAAAIEVCSKEAHVLAENVGEQLGVRIGRTALKLRNPANASPAWAEPLLSATPSVATFVDLPHNQLGALLPIRLKEACTTCHGPVDTIPPDVREALTAWYPNDEATGFQVGDLRGWFWVEVDTAVATTQRGR